MGCIGSKAGKGEWKRGRDVLRGCCLNVSNASVTNDALSDDLLKESNSIKDGIDHQIEVCTGSRHFLNLC